MDDDRIERLLRGYQLPDAPRSLDRHVMAEAGAILARERGRAALAGIARDVADAFGFGYLNYVVDLVTAIDADYHVDLI